MLAGSLGSSIAQVSKAKYSSSIMTSASVLSLAGYTGSLVTGHLQDKHTQAAIAQARVETQPPKVQLALVPMRRGAALTGRF